jgi:hypothetical protein
MGGLTVKLIKLLVSGPLTCPGPFQGPGRGPGNVFTRSYVFAKFAKVKDLTTSG